MRFPETGIGEDPAQNQLHLLLVDPVVLVPIDVLPGYLRIHFEKPGDSRFHELNPGLFDFRKA